jgi:hypothetical protein
MGFKLAQPVGVAVPLTEERALAASQAFLEGSPIVRDVDDNYTECGADPDLIDAISLAPCGANTSGFSFLTGKEFPPGRMQGTTLRGTYWRTTFTGSKPAATGGSYGIVKDTDNEWKVDFSDTTNVCVKYERDLSLDLGMGAEVLVSFLDAVVGSP